jgi:hypothetical protein
MGFKKKKVGSVFGQKGDVFLFSSGGVFFFP